MQRIEFVGLSPELQQRVQNRLTVRAGDTLEKGGLDRLREELQQIDEHLYARARGDYNLQRRHQSSPSCWCRRPSPGRDA